MKTKKTILVVLMVLVLSTCFFTACNSENEIANLDDGKTRICLLVNGNLGDMSFFDSANTGMKKFAEDYPDCEVKVIEMGSDDSNWEPTLRQTANEAYDLILLSTTQMAEPLQRLVKDEAYNDRRFVLFDCEIDENNSAEYPTVHSILFKQNEGGFIAGALAALMAHEGGFNETAFIGGMKIDIINDFGAGYMQGIKKVNEDKEIDIRARDAYVGDFFNSPKGKSLADAFYKNTNVLFAAASQAGQGCIESAKDNDKYIVGVDSDQYAYFKDTDKEKADTIITSILKRADIAVYNACKDFVEGDLEFGKLEYVGVKEGAMDYVKNENYEKLVSEENRTYIENLYQGIVDGTVEVKSGLKRFMSLDELNALYDSLKPEK